MKVLVVGNGVAAAGFLHAASTRGLVCDHLADSSNAPVCSQNSTAVAALRGTVKGHSPLGDLLVDGWEEAKNFYRRYSGAGVERATHTTAIFEQEKNLARFAHVPPGLSPLGLKQEPKLLVQEEAWIIHPEEFLASFTPQKQLIVAVDAAGPKPVVTLLGGERRTYDHVVLCTGHWLSWMKDQVPVPELKAVQGSFYQWSDVTLPGESFSLSVDDVNLVYHAAKKRLLLGATSVKHETGDFADVSDLQARYQKLQGRLEHPLPRPELAEVRTGIRSVSRSRMPFALNPLPGIHLIGGLYKNGWVMAWHLGRVTLERLT